MKKGPIALVLWLGCFVGLCGLHRFYVNRPWTGILWFLTLGFFGVGQIIDLFRLGSMVREASLMNGAKEIMHASYQARQRRESLGQDDHARIGNGRGR